MLIDGQDIRTFDLTSYRRQLGIVPQTPFLFTGTVADNIRYAKPEANDDEVRAVAERIGGGDWLDVLEDGLETDVGEEGRGISMGQRQLVALARVLIQDPAIVILDEATATVDPLTEAQIQEGLDEVLREPHRHRHRPPAVDHQGGRPHHRAAQGRDHRRRRPRHADGAGRPLRRALQHLLPPPVAGL